MTDGNLKIFDFAADSSKQMIALATGVTAVTISFAKDLVGNITDATHVLGIISIGARTALGWSWIGYLASVIFGLFTMLSLTGQLKKAQPNAYAAQVVIPAIIQCVVFVAATVLVLAVGLAALPHLGVSAGTTTP
jgi:type IV secretory pathway VirB2 component (pilin)